MANVSFEAFFPEVLPFVAGCAGIIATNAVRNAAIEFCTGSMYWQETQDPVTVTATSFPYDLDAPSGAGVAQVLSVTVDGLPLVPATLDMLDTSGGYNWRTQTGSAISNYYQDNPKQIGLYPLPETAKTLVMRVAYAPLRTASGIEEHVYQKYLEEIAAGALGRLMLMPAQMWSNPTAGAHFRAKFMQGITDAAVAANKSFNRSGATVQARPLA